MEIGDSFTEIKSGSSYQVVGMHFDTAENMTKQNPDMVIGRRWGGVDFVHHEFHASEILTKAKTGLKMIRSKVILRHGRTGFTETVEPVEAPCEMVVICTNYQGKEYFSTEEVQGVIAASFFYV